MRMQMFLIGFFLGIVMAAPVLAQEQWRVTQDIDGDTYVAGACTVRSLRHEVKVVASVVEADDTHGTYLQVSTIFRDEVGTPLMQWKTVEVIPPSAGAERSELAKEDIFYVLCSDKAESLPQEVKQRFAGYYNIQ